MKNFEDKLIYAKDGRRLLITGYLVLTIVNGVASLGELCFTDSSSWRRSRKFMIGASLEYNSTGLRIRETKSQALVVKDHRGESYKKHHSLSLSDKIWHLENASWLTAKLLVMFFDIMPDDICRSACLDGVA